MEPSGHNIVIQRLSLLLLLFFSATCAPASAPPPAQTITVMAAASLSGAFTEIGAAFEQQQPGAEVIFNFAGSQQLAQQLAQGAPADVFASANARQMEVAVENGRVAPGTSRIFAQNRLVIIVPRDNPAALSVWQDLAKPGATLVFAAREVPAGQYSLEFLDRAGIAFSEAARGNIVSYEDNVRAVLAKVSLGEADAGVVYTSDVSGSAAEQVQRIPIPVALNPTASYPIAAIQDSPQPGLARAFVDFVLSQPGQKILAKHGFLPAEE